MEIYSADVRFEMYRFQHPGNLKQISSNIMKLAWSKFWVKKANCCCVICYLMFRKNILRINLSNLLSSLRPNHWVLWDHPTTVLGLISGLGQFRRWTFRKDFLALGVLGNAPGKIITWHHVAQMLIPHTQTIPNCCVVSLTFIYFPQASSNKELHEKLTSH